jgi:hypothetical protein
MSSTAAWLMIYATIRLRRFKDEGRYPGVVPTGGGKSFSPVVDIAQHRAGLIGPLRLLGASERYSLFTTCY